MRTQIPFIHKIAAMLKEHEETFSRRCADSNGKCISIENIARDLNYQPRLAFQASALREDATASKRNMNVSKEIAGPELPNRENRRPTTSTSPAFFNQK